MIVGGGLLNPATNENLSPVPSPTGSDLEEMKCENLFGSY
jgi:hypothetical protein